MGVAAAGTRLMLKAISKLLYGDQCQKGTQTRNYMCYSKRFIPHQPHDRPWRRFMPRTDLPDLEARIFLRQSPVTDGIIIGPRQPAPKRAESYHAGTSKGLCLAVVRVSQSDCSASMIYLRYIFKSLVDDDV